MTDNKKVGRPFSDNPKDVMLRVRVDKDIIEKLDRCKAELGTTRSGVVRMGIDKIFKFVIEDDDKTHS